MGSNKTVKWLSFFLIAMVLAVIGGCAKSEEAAKQPDEQKAITIRLASWGGQDHPGLTSWVPIFTEEVEKGTNGRVKVEYYPGGQLGEDKDMPVAIPSGTVDMGWITINGWSGLVPQVKILDSPAFTLTMEQTAKAIDMPGGFNEVIGKEFEKVGVKLLSWTDIGPGVIVSNKSIRKPGDLKGLKVRTYSEGGANVVLECGGKPTSIAFGEIYTALQRKTVDGAHMGLQGITSQRAYEVSKYTLIPNGFLGTPIMGYAMNLNKFNSLPADIQKVVLDAARKAELNCRQELIASRQDIINTAREKGMDLYELNPSTPEYAEWEKKLQPVIENDRKQFSKELLDIIDKAKS